MVVVREAWVEKSSGGKKDGATGALLSGKENWKKRYVVVEDAPKPTLSWYKTDKVSRPNTSEPRTGRIHRRAAHASPANGTARPLWRRRRLHRGSRRKGRSS